MKMLLFVYLLPIFLIFLLVILSLNKGIKNNLFGEIGSKVVVFSILGFSYFGLTIGFFVGLSSTSVLSAVLPALLTFIGGIMTYYFFNTSNTSSLGNQILSMVALICISIFLTIGAYHGVQQRQVYEISQREMEIDKEVTLKKIDNEIKKEIIQFEHDLKFNGVEETIKFENLPDLKQAIKDSTQHITR